MEVAEDGRTMEAEAVVFALARHRKSDETLVVDVAGGLFSVHREDVKRRQSGHGGDLCVRRCLLCVIILAMTVITLLAV